jgi:photosystem II stability/assembly factor-like uncharacterized protein
MSVALPEVGTLVVDTLTERTGHFMGVEGPYAMLRPQGGGKEWEALPERVVSAEGES